MAALVLFPSRVRFVNDDGTLAPEAYRALQEIVNRTGGTLGNVGVDTFSVDTYGDLSNSSLNVAYTDITQPGTAGAVGDMTMQPAEKQALLEMVMQPESRRVPDTVNAASTDLPTVIELCNQLRAALIANNIII